MTSMDGCHGVGMATIKEDTTQELTPAAVFRNQYLETQSATTDSILFEPKSNIEPKIILQEDRGSTLLSKLSKSTAPMREKLSRSKTNLDHLWITSSTTLTLPLRKSAESVHHMSISRKKRKEQERSRSFSFESSPKSPTMIEPPIYPALLSKIAYAFKEAIELTTKTKDHIEYHNVFDGKDAVNKLAAIIKTSDRNLAILVGRSLDHQKYFHDVNYEHRLRDSSNELYQFKEQLVIKNKDRESIEDTHLPNGIFTLLTDCYSPTCTAQNICYSALCPRRFNQKQNHIFEENEDRLWIRTVSKSISSHLSSKEKRRQENIFELIYTEKDFIDDLIYVEKNWIEPLLSHDCISPEQRDEFIKDVFWNIKQVRINNSILLHDLQQRQQSQKVVSKIGDIFIKHVSKLFEQFVEYGSHQVIGRYIFENEKQTNPQFARFVEMVERAPESRKLELNGYLTKPTTRLGRYNLLLKEILKHTPENHPDCESIPKAIQLISQFLQRVNEESGKTENRLSLDLLEQKLTFNKKSLQHQDVMDLDLSSKDRKIIMKGSLKRKNINTSSESSEFQVYALDHCLVIVKSKVFDNVEIFKLYKKPIPLALLAITLPDQTRRSSSILPYNRSSTGSFYSTSSDQLPLLTSSSTPITTKSGYPISFIHLGRQGSATTTLYAPTLASRRQWVDTIEQYRDSVMEASSRFRMVPISSTYFTTFNKVHCAATFRSFIVFGCDHGVYLKPNTADDDDIIKIVSIDKVSQIDVLQDHILLVLAEKVLYTFALDTLFDKDNNIISPLNTSPSSASSSRHSLESMHSDSSVTKQLKRISSNVSFFKVGRVIANGVPRILVCFVKLNTTSSSIRALEPYQEKALEKKKKRTNLNVFIRNTTEALQVYKDLYIPGEATSIQYFKSSISVGSVKGFQMVDISSTEVQSVLDPNDEHHAWITQRESLKPISMFKHPDGCILLCYNEIGFYIDKKGRRVRPDWIVHWEGYPNTFAFHYPYIIAFDSSFIEIRHVNTGDLTQVITGSNIRCLRWDESIYFVMDDRKSGSELIYQLQYITE